MIKCDLQNSCFNSSLMITFVIILQYFHRFCLSLLYSGRINKMYWDRSPIVLCKCSLQTDEKLFDLCEKSFKTLNIYNYTQPSCITFVKFQLFVKVCEKLYYGHYFLEFIPSNDKSTTMTLTKCIFHKSFIQSKRLRFFAFVP